MNRKQANIVLKLSSQQQQSLIAFARKMVQTPSFSGMEGTLAQLVSEEMARVGFDEVRLDDMGNVVGQIGSGQKPHLLLYTHLDTVGIGNIGAWQRDPLGGVVEDGVLYGRGAADPKGALASMVYGASLLKGNRVRLKGTLYVAAGVQGEPAEGVAMRYLLERGGVEPAWVVIGGPTRLQIHRGQRGRLEMHVTVHGRACHAATPGRGVNAIYGAARIIFSLELMAAALAEDSFLGPGTLAVTHIENIERTKNVIPDCCSFIIDRRLTLGETEAQALADVQGLLAKEGVEGQVAVSTVKSVSYTGLPFSERISYPAWATDEKDPLVKQVSKSVQAVTGLKPALRRWEFSTAGVYSMGEAGIPTIGFGPGDERFAHTAEDHIPLRDCFTAARVYARIARDLLG